MKTEIAITTAAKNIRGDDNAGAINILWAYD